MSDEEGPDLSCFNFGDDSSEEAVKSPAQPTANAATAKRGKKRDKKAEKERQREARMAEVRAGAGPALREIEMEALRARLTPAGLEIVEIAADGHCLYRSLAHQLSDSGEPTDYVTCRKTCAEYIRAHPSDFVPYLLGEGIDEDGLPAYCERVEASAEWGGQLEITALAHARKRCVEVYSADAPPLVTGGEYDANGPRLRLAYHRHYYGLGEHFNALRPIM